MPVSEDDVTAELYRLAAVFSKQHGHVSPKRQPDSAFSTIDETKNVPTMKAFHNWGFLSSPEARQLRILCEFEETKSRLRDNGVIGTILFFGSARSMYRSTLTHLQETTQAELAKAEERGKQLKQALLDAQDGDTARITQQIDAAAKEVSIAQVKLERLKSTEWMTKFCDIAEELARRLTQWTMNADVNKRLLESADSAAYFVDGVFSKDKIEASHQCYVVSSGGGPGLMMAVNKGARSVEGARTMGMGISLPFEQGLNPYVSQELAFEFHYFFTRKFWMMYPAKALIACPGGYGTFDELFEALTLRQTGKLPTHTPIVLLGKDFWETAVNWKQLAAFGVISFNDFEQLLITDSIDEAYEYIIAKLDPSYRTSAPAPGFTPVLKHGNAPAAMSPMPALTALPPSVEDVPAK